MFKHAKPELTFTRLPANSLTSAPSLHAARIFFSSYCQNTLSAKCRPQRHVKLVRTMHLVLVLSVDQAAKPFDLG